MRTALKTMSIIMVVIGGFAILESADGGQDAGYAFLGGLLFLAEGILALVYIGQNKE